MFQKIYSGVGCDWIQVGLELVSLLAQKSSHLLLVYHQQPFPDKWITIYHLLQCRPWDTALEPYITLIIMNMLTFIRTRHNVCVYKYILLDQYYIYIYTHHFLPPIEKISDVKLFTFKSENFLTAQENLGFESFSSKDRISQLVRGDATMTSTPNSQ